MTFPQIRKSDGLLCLGVLLILVAYVVSVIRLHPTNFFGLFEDDSIYFSSAKALAQGQGYVLPSVPGTPPATKYPILYPLILSLVWRWNPSFPANLSGAVAATVTFGVLYLVAGFFFLRRLDVFSDLETIVLTAFCALNPLVLFFSGNVLSDVPFAALALIAMVLADKLIDANSSTGLAVLCGFVAGLSMLMRVFGLTVVAGILVAVGIRHAWKKLLIFAVCVAPFFMIILWRNIVLPTTNVSSYGFSSANLGWMRAWAYYTSYITMWKMSVPNVHILFSMMRANVVLLITASADLFVSPSLVSSNTLLRIVVDLLFFVVTVGGLVRRVRTHGLNSSHFALAFYLPLILLWNYPDAGNRFLLPFYFLLVSGFWFEMKHVFFSAYSVLLGTKSSPSEKPLAAVLATGVLFVGFATTLDYLIRPSDGLHALSEKRAQISEAKQEAYRWLVNQSHDRHEVIHPVLAYEDANLYLHTGLSSIRPVIFVTSVVHETSYVDESLLHLMDVAKAVDARYWLFSEDDFVQEPANAALTLRKCLGPGGPDRWPKVFSSRDGRVVIRSLQSSGYENACITTSN